jgi:hypothetical protein
MTVLIGFDFSHTVALFNTIDALVQLESSLQTFVLIEIWNFVLCKADFDLNDLIIMRARENEKREFGLCPVRIAAYD